MSKEAIEKLEKSKAMLLGSCPRSYSQQKLYDWIDQALALLREEPEAGAQIDELKEGGYIRHKQNCNMGEYNSILTGKGCTCGLSEALKEKQEVTEYERLLDKHIEAVRHIHCLCEDLDAECRVSQMLLVGQKKLQAQLKTKDELLEWAWVDCGSQKDLTGYLENLEYMNRDTK